MEIALGSSHLLGIWAGGRDLRRARCDRPSGDAEPRGYELLARQRRVQIRWSDPLSLHVRR